MWPKPQETSFFCALLRQYFLFYVFPKVFSKWLFVRYSFMKLVWKDMKVIRDHSFSTYVKFSGKLIFLTPWYAQVRWSVRSLHKNQCLTRVFFEKLILPKNFRIHFILRFVLFASEISSSVETLQMELYVCWTTMGKNLKGAERIRRLPKPLVASNFCKITKETSLSASYKGEAEDTRSLQNFLFIKCQCNLVLKLF